MNIFTKAVLCFLSIVLTIVSVVALFCAAAIAGAIYVLLYLIGAMSVIVVGVYMWWYTLWVKVVNLSND